MLLPLYGEHNEVVSLCIEFCVTDAPYGGGDEGKLQQADDLTPWWPLTSCQHGQKWAGDDEEGAAFTTKYIIMKNCDFLQWDDMSHSVNNVSHY